MNSTLQQQQSQITGKELFDLVGMAQWNLPFLFKFCGYHRVHNLLKISPHMG